MNINPTNKDPGLGNKVLHFCRLIGKLKEISPPYLPCIRDFGIATKSSCLFLVTDMAEGERWDKLNPPDNSELTIIGQLISTIEHLHGLNIAHGDLHPENIFVDCEQSPPQIFLIDIPDFSLDEEQPFNHRYSPENIDGCTAFERDNFAVMRMSCELLGSEWGDDSTDFPAITKVITLETEDTLFGFKDLSRFKDAILSPEADDELEVIDIVVLGQFEPLTIYPDNGKLYAQIEPSRKNPSEARIKLLGIGGWVDLIYSPAQNSFVVGFEPKQRASVSYKDIEASQLTLSFALRINGNTNSDLFALSKRLRNDDELQRAVNLALFPEPQSESTEIVSEQLKKAFESVQTDQTSKVTIKTTKLWQAILDTETESYPYIEVSDAVFEPKGGQDDKRDKEQLIVPYNSDSDALDQFNKTDIIEALKIDGDNVQLLGIVSLKQSALNEIRLNKLRFRAKGLEEGDLVYFRTKQDKASYDKRKDALERLLSREGTISELVDYFEPDCNASALAYDVDVTDQDFARYDRKDDHGNAISLNQQQREAFTKIIKNGPLSLLQGPPGTGKTEFIAAFVHFLVEKLGVNSILLVSQSHEAVNTAAERIRKHCTRLDTPLDVVRFSNRVGAVSTGLKDVYSRALVTEKRELFAAEADYRVAALSQALGLEGEYLADLINLELKVFKQIDEFAVILHSLADSAVVDEDKKDLKQIAKTLDISIRQMLDEQYQLKVSNTQDLADAKQLLLQQLELRHGIKPDEAKRANALAKISSDMLDVLAADRVNYDEFLARSRQLVTGTCVGIGQRHIGIQGNQYDWVIIDEAARSIASELAIAMQSGKRVLLVGDHQQLPPLYTDPHKKALARKLGIATKENDLDSVLLSDFARVFESPYGKQTGAQLLTQYRMAPAIGTLVSQSFYQGQLKNGDRQIPAIYHNAPQAIDSVVTWLDTSKLNNAKHQDDKGISIYNRCEATQIIAVLRQMADNVDFVNALSASVKEGEPAIGVICMYGEQKRLLRQQFKEIVWSDKFKSLVKIDTVDSYQGKENRIIIVSVTRFDKRLSPGFLRLPNRINVALSRAMDRLLIVGAADMWRSKNQHLPLGRVVNFIQGQNNNLHYQLIPAQSKNNTGRKSQ